MDTSSTLGGLAALTDWGLIRARGEDAGTFLHGQLTQDITGMAVLEARQAGYCSAKGRLLASFVVCRVATDEWLLACSADLLAPTLRRLSMFVMRAKCRLDDVSGAFGLFGIAGPTLPAVLGIEAAPAVGRAAFAGRHLLIRLADVESTMRYLWLQSADEPAPSLPALAQDAWRWLEVRSGVPRIVAATSEQFVPQMVNLELVGGVSFTKGCYPGQEVVARSQYRGTLKRRMLPFDVVGEAAPGQEVFHAGDPSQPAGMVVNAAPSPIAAGTTSALVEIKLAALDGQAIYLGAADGPAMIATALPYTLPTAEAA